jgi:hypothetical protein
LVDAQLVTLFTPVIAQLPVGVGATAPTGPVTVAVKEIEVPSAAVAAFAVTDTVGVTGFTVVELPDVGELAR